MEQPKFAHSSNALFLLCAPNIIILIGQQNKSFVLLLKGSLLHARYDRTLGMRIRKGFHGVFCR